MDRRHKSRRTNDEAGSAEIEVAQSYYKSFSSFSKKLKHPSFPDTVKLNFNCLTLTNHTYLHQKYQKQNSQETTSHYC